MATLSHLSASQLTLYLTCSLKFRFQYIDKLPRILKSANQVFGLAMHAALQWLHVELKNGRKPPLDEVLRVYEADGQTTSEVSICYRGLSHLYIVLGERRSAGGRPVWLVRAYWNPLATLLFLGPVIMALGGAVSLSDRRLRLGVAARRREQPA